MDRGGRLGGCFKHRGNRIVAEDYGGRLLGWYDISSNRTYPYAGIAVGTGNLTGMFYVFKRCRQMFPSAYENHAGAIRRRPGLAR